jgi:hypothetical protein
MDALVFFYFSLLFKLQVINAVYYPVDNSTIKKVFLFSNHYNDIELTNPASEKYSLIKPKDKIVDARSFGFSASNEDNSVALQRAVDFCGNDSSYIIKMPAGSFKFNGPVALGSAKLLGDSIQQTEFLISKGFRFNSSLPTRQSRACFYNKGFASKYISSKSNTIQIENIRFVSQAESDAVPVITVLLLGNVSSGEIKDCDFIAQTNNSPASNTLIDVNSCVKNLVFSNCKVHNFNDKSQGGGMWIRNQSYEGGNPENFTENILLYKVEFKQAASDEALSIFGSMGMTRHVNVIQCSFYGLRSSKTHSVLVSVFPLESQLGGNYTGVRDISIINCLFIDSSFRNYILRIGGSSLKDHDNICENIVVNGNTFYSYSNASTPKASIILRVPNKGNNICANNNIIFNKSDGPIGYGIRGFSENINNKISERNIRVISSVH